MRVVAGLLKWLGALALVAIAGVAGWLTIAPPELIRVGSAYSAKIVCSNVFVAGRDATQVMAEDVQAPGHPLLRLMRVDVDRQSRRVDVVLLGLFGRSTAVMREGTGCASVPDGDIARASEPALKPFEAVDGSGLWPQGQEVEPSQNSELAKILDDPAMTGPGMRAVVVVKNGRIVAERYGEGFDAATPLLGWSMTKSVTAGIIGTLVKAGRMDVEAGNVLPEDPLSVGTANRKEVSIADLMAMSSGLQFNEGYGDVSDVTRMLFLTPDMANFAACKPVEQQPGSVFNYSSGTTVFLSRLWQNAAGSDSLEWPGEKLFRPLGMNSAVLETDEAGTYVGSSYMYATGRDWARYGQFLLQKGVWNGQEILPAGFVDWMTQPAPASGGVYGRGQVWLQGPGDDKKAEVALGVPADAFWMLGHDGQSATIIPSRQMVVVRLGLTPAKLGYTPEAMVGALVKALE